MKLFFAEVEEAARVYGRNVSISIPGKEDATFEETNVLFADSTWMDMMTFDFVRGKKKGALHDKFTVVINEEMATKYFGDKDPIGESLRFGGKHDFKVIAVVKNFPLNAHIRFNMLVPYDNMYDMEDARAGEAMRNNFSKNFIISHSYTYVLLKPGADPRKVDERMPDFLKKFANPQFLVGQVFTLMPVTDIHLKSTLLAEPSTTNSESNLLIFAAVGILTLLIASINYVNLSTAQSLNRIKEIGIRKIMGSLRFQLISQFLAESFLFCMIAMLLSYVMFYLALPVLNTLTGLELSFTQVLDASLLIWSTCLLLLITALSGAYPSYFVAQFHSISALKGNSSQQQGGQFLRKALVVVQLCIACMLLSGSLLIIKQLDYLQSRPLGFKKDQIITIPLFSQNLNGIFRENDSTYFTRLQTFRDAVESQAGIYKTTLSANAPGLGTIYRGTIPEGFTKEDNLFVANMPVDYDFIDAYNIKILAGRSFDKSYGTDGNEAYIVNETAVREFKWGTPQEAIGKTINREGKVGKVIGVTQDFHFASLTTPVTSIVLEIDPDQFNTLSVQFENNNVQETVDKIGAVWNKIFPEKTFEYGFLDRQLTSQYQNFDNFSTIIQVFTTLAIVIACLGVYGLVLFVVQQKVKEIGVRKVLGASVMNIIRLIYSDFVLLLLIGFIVAIPISYYFMKKWLLNFSYQINIDAITYIFSFIIVFLIVALTIGYQAVKASLANPAVSLRTE
jgi:putative ABC transport system permease protein